MNCSEITRIITDAKELNIPVDGLLQGDDAGTLVKQQELVEGKTREFYNEYPDLGQEFMDYVKDDANWGDIVCQANSVTTSLTNTQFFESIHPAQSWDYKMFLIKLVPLLESKGMLSENNRTYDRVIDFVNSAFLSCYPKKEGLVIKQKDLPAVLANKSFGLKLGGNPKLHIDHLAGGAFFLMEGGEVYLENYSKSDITEHNFVATAMLGGYLNIENINAELIGQIMIGQIMTGGTISIGNLNNGALGTRMEGGTIFVKDYYLGENLKRGPKGVGVCQNATGGTCVIGNIPGHQFELQGLDRATILVKSPRNKVGNEKSNRYNGWLACYDETLDQFESAGAKLPFCYEDWQSGMPKLAQGCYEGLHILKFPFRQQDGYDWLYNGIIVLKQSGDSNKIGRGQRGGAIIIDDDNISFEEACRRVAPRSERPGGIVLYLRKWEEPIRKIGKYGFGKRKRAEFVEIT